ncbi:MAG: adenine phosphoribosyltransferase [Treponema sp.]|jgi:adenine phosphoribosyltransferase|nr:adenine phosphoribosyltransferase [Treponema sp.]
MDKQVLLDKSIRRVPDFPKPGILFYDISGILMVPEAFSYCIEKMCELVKKSGANTLAGIETRGLIFSAVIAERLGMPLMLVRKKGKLPGKTYSCSYALEYGTAEIEIHVADVKPGQKVLLVDDLIATGGTLKAARSLMEMGGAQVTGYLGAVGLPFLKYDEALAPLPVMTVINYDAE